MDDVNISIIFDYVGRYTYMWQECHVAADGQSPECACQCQGPECLAPGVICDTSGKAHQTFADFAIWKCELFLETW